jgi:hypothetical protein
MAGWMAMDYEVESGMNENGKKWMKLLDSIES